MIFSARRLRQQQADYLAPSLGVPIIADTDGALSALEASMRVLLAPRGIPSRNLDDDPLRQVSAHVYQSTFGNASTWFIISESGKALAIDYGYHCQVASSGYPYPRNRRALLHGMDALKTRWGIDGVDVVLVTHFHDDHVNGIPTLQRVYGTRCWAGENFAQLLADPMGYNFPCTWPEPIAVEAQPLGVPIPWEEYTFTLEPMSGHTRWSTSISFRADDITFLATGDQYFFNDWNSTDFAHNSAMHNHVYRNGAVLESFHASNAILHRVNPEMILPGHGTAYRTNEDFFRLIEKYADDYTALHTRAMPLGADDVHFEVDSRGGWLYPYRTRLDAAAPLELSRGRAQPLAHRGGIDRAHGRSGRMAGVSRHRLRRSPHGSDGRADHYPAGAYLLPPPAGGSGTHHRRAPLRAGGGGAGEHRVSAVLSPLGSQASPPADISARQ